MKTLEQLLQSLNSKLWIKPLEAQPSVDSVMYGDKHICCIPKGGKYKSWFEMMSDAVRAEGLATHDGIQHRSMTGLIETLAGRGIIRLDGSPLQYEYEKLQETIPGKK